jgi:hypothetical protein
MPATQKTYPEWVQKYRVQGTTVKKKGDAYYLYKRTSKRIPGKKYPQPVDTYIGIITPDGVIETKKKKVSLTDIEVWEYGFSKAILHLCPKGWKAPLGDNWEDILRILVCDWSTYSYLGMQPLRSKEEFRCQFNSQAASLRRRIHMTSNVEIIELEKLKSIYLLIMGKDKVISKITPEQQELLDRIGLKLEVD